MEAFSRALRQLPSIIADNAGYDSADLVSQLRAAHAAGQTSAGELLIFLLTVDVNIALAASGLDMYNGCIADMWDLGVRESFRSKLQVEL